jgi:hypothetical protein
MGDFFAYLHVSNSVVTRFKMIRLCLTSCQQVATRGRVVQCQGMEWPRDGYRRIIKAKTFLQSGRVILIGYIQEIGIALQCLVAVGNGAGNK